jgi:hypothetical protein
MIPTPFYIQNEGLSVHNDGDLFHFTKAKTLFNIIDSMTIKTSSLKDLNDLNEVNVSTCNLCHTDFEIELQDFLLNRCSTISFCKNYWVDGFFQEGTNHPRMWTQYAQKNEGICLVLDEKSFVEQNKDIFSRCVYKIEDVNYLLYSELPKPDRRNLSVLEYVIQNYKQIFFQKHLDWQQENERRLWGIDLPKYLNIFGAIKYICLGVHFVNKKENIRGLKDIINDSSSPCYKYLTPHSFAFTSYGKHGYYTTSAAHFFATNKIL